MKLILIDLDGIVADNEARFRRAMKPDGLIDWRVAFDPALVNLDVLINGAKEAVETLAAQEDQLVMFLTSRPEAMRAATLAWLAKHGLPAQDADVIMKPKSAQFTKTTKWKAEVVGRLAEHYESVVFIDDEENNRVAVEALQRNVTCHACLADITMSK